jgi:hypothetical protein
MARHRRPKLVIHAAPASSSIPPAAAKPAADTRSGAAKLVDALIQLFGVAVFVVGLIAIAAWIEGGRNPSMSPGLVCYDITRSTVDGSERSRHCEPQRGWHYERIPGGPYPVPDRARRYPVWGSG